MGEGGFAKDGGGGGLRLGGGGEEGFGCAVGTEEAVDGVVGVVVVQPFDAAGDAFEFEAEAFGDGAAAEVFGGAFDGDAVEFPFFEGVRDEEAAAVGHDALSLMGFIEPIGEDEGAVGPVNVEVADHAAKFFLEPDAGEDAAGDEGLLVPEGDGSVDVADGTEFVDPGMPGAEVFAVGLEELEQFGERGGG